MFRRFEKINTDEEKKIFMSKRTSYNSWPQIVKDEFIQNVNGTINTDIFKLKQSFNNLTKFEKDLYYLLENLIQSKSSDIPGMKETCGKLQYNILFPEFQFAKELPSSLFNIFKNKIMTPESKSWNLIQNIESLKSSISNPILKPICNNLGPIVGGVFGLVNLLLAAKDFSTISKEVEKFEEFKKELENIINEYKENKESILKFDNIFHTSLENIIEKINNGLEKIKKNINQLNNLIIRIEKEIEICEKKKNISLASQFISALFSGFSYGNYFATRNNYHLVNGSIHLGGTIINGINLVRYTLLIKDLKALLEESKREREKMNEDIKIIRNYLATKLKIIIQGIPTYC